MIGAPDIRDSVLIPGCYDILSPDHRQFISSCVAALATEVSFDTVVFGLVPDRAMQAKGKYRPFFNYEWRQEDIGDWFASVDPDQQVGFDEFYPGKILRSPVPEQKYKAAALSTEYEGRVASEATAKLAERTVFVPPVNGTHTSDIESTLRGARDSANCDWRVGAVLLRDGLVAGQYQNGGPEPDSCLSCSKGLDVRRTKAETGYVKPSPVPCDYEHAEKQAVLDACPGDYLLSTVSPCQDCAESIVKSGIERVVYLRPYHKTLDPADYLAANGVRIRPAGYRLGDD
jgi:deoxycytidylate deaminase